MRAIAFLLKGKVNGKRQTASIISVFTLRKLELFALYELMNSQRLTDTLVFQNTVQQAHNASRL